MRIIPNILNYTYETIKVYGHSKVLNIYNTRFE